MKITLLYEILGQINLENPVKYFRQPFFMDVIDKIKRLILFNTF